MLLGKESWAKSERYNEIQKAKNKPNMNIEDAESTIESDKTSERFAEYDPKKEIAESNQGD